MKTTFKIEGMDKLKKDLERIGKVPQRHVASASKAGMTIALRDARANAPYDTGELKKGIILSGEKSRYTGKKVYQIIFNPKMNDIYQKKAKYAMKKVRDRSEKGRKYKLILKEYYYPASQEYGYFLRNGLYMPGLRFIHNSLTENTLRISNKMVVTMQKKIDAEIKKVGLK